MAKKKKVGITIEKKRVRGVNILVVPKDATLRQIYAALKKQFTAADLVKYLEDEPTMPTEQLVAEMEQIQLEETQKRQKRRRKT